MKFSITTAVLAAALGVLPAYAQFGYSVVYDPTQSAHAIQQIAQANRLYTTTIETTRNVIANYNLAMRMASLPQSLYTSYSNTGLQEWNSLVHPANTYGNSAAWMNAASTGYGAEMATQAASISQAGRIPGYSSLTPAGRQMIAAQGATVDLDNAVDASSLQTIGRIRAESAQRESDIAALEAASHSSSPTEHTEMATLQRINQALLIQLRTQQETNQILQAAVLQQVVGQKVQQDNLKSLFATASDYQQSFDAVTPQETSSGTEWAFHY